MNPLNFAAFFFTKLDCGLLYTCNICNNGRPYSQPAKKGVGNLMAHLRAAHGGFEHKYKEATAGSAGTLESHAFTSERASGLFRWLLWIVSSNLPLAVADDDQYRKNTNMPPTSSTTLRKLMYRVERIVEAKLTDAIPDKFALAFDLWSSGGTSFCGVFASWYDTTSNCVVNPLIAMCPMGSETSWTADAHIRFLTETLHKVDKAMTDIMCLVGDNCETNKSIARKLKIPLVGCASHRLNLAVQRYLKDYDGLVSKVSAVMTRLKTNKNRGFLRQFTHLAPQGKNDTRWTSTLTMLQRYIELMPHLGKIKDIEQLVLPLSKADELMALVKICQEFEGYTLVLQEDGLMLHEVRDLFDKLMERYPTMDIYLAPDSHIVCHPSFESAVVKVLDGKEGLLTAAEKVEIARLLLDQPEPVPVTDVEAVHPRAIASMELKAKRRRLDTPPPSTYLNMRFILPTSNIVERVFSKTKLVFTEQRQRLLPTTLEAIVFLAVNRAFWDASTVEQAIRQQPALHS
jgi:hypothetical protein